mgnify:CR=1 FL=1
MMNAVLFAGSRESLTATRLMRNSKFPEPPMITDLPEEKRKLAKEQVQKLASTLKECSSYAETGYATGKSNVVKCLGMIAMAERTLIEVSDALARIHGLTE